MELKQQVILLRAYKLACEHIREIAGRLILKYRMDTEDYGLFLDEGYNESYEDYFKWLAENKIKGSS